MSMNIKRRVFLKGSLAAGTLGVAAGAGLLTPRPLSLPGMKRLSMPRASTTH